MDINEGKIKYEAGLAVLDRMKDVYGYCRNLNISVAPVDPVELTRLIIEEEYAALDRARDKETQKGKVGF